MALGSCRPLAMRGPVFGRSYWRQGHGGVAAPPKSNTRAAKAVWALWELMALLERRLAAKVFGGIRREGAAPTNSEGIRDGGTARTALLQRLIKLSYRDTGLAGHAGDDEVIKWLIVCAQRNFAKRCAVAHPVFMARALLGAGCETQVLENVTHLSGPQGPLPPAHAGAGTMGMAVSKL